ncbi:hypothetical protein JQC67_08720 [Aurantibacter crassamenti]|uniref:hypothetical protein n=1 Tax=Aurantibacter crassamenti TaxID=1837375 RepID=UPI00193AB3F3|nr:hypothetical protein [Aurantibacter crassamenti]MBM1106216.1 hypothetical protein [Aurantibacter crassamenti]
MSAQEIQHSDYRIRKLIGALGLALPFLLPLTEGQFLSSISHYYYLSFSSLLFIIILSSFGLFLISYRGYKVDATEKISDDMLTNIGGIAALIVVFFPTYCSSSESIPINDLCVSNSYPLLGHNDKTTNTIHLISAAVFIFTMGWMSKFKFTRGNNTTNNKIYAICGNIVWGTLVLLFMLFIADLIQDGFKITKYDVYILETIAVVPFAVSWLIKGKTMEHIKELFIK